MSHDGQDSWKAQWARLFRRRNWAMESLGKAVQKWKRRERCEEWIKLCGRRIYRRQGRLARQFCRIHKLAYRHSKQQAQMVQIMENIIRLFNHFTISPVSLLIFKCHCTYLFNLILHCSRQHTVVCKSICPRPDFLFFLCLSHLKCFKSSNKCKYSTMITQVNTKCSFFNEGVHCQGEKFQTSMALCEKVIAGPL